MSLKEHPDFQEETNRLKETIEYIENALIIAESSRRELNADTREAYVELDYLDSSCVFQLASLLMLLFSSSETRLFLRAYEPPSY